MSVHDTQLTGAGLLLRPWAPDDAGPMSEAVRESMDSVGRWLSWCHAGYDLDEARAWVAHCREEWAAQEHFAFGVFEPATGRLLGSVGLNQRNRQHRSASLGYWVRQSCQRRGVASRAVRLAAGFGFDRLGLVRIEIVALPHHHASRRTAEKAGARFEAIARNRIWTGAAAQPGAVYALLPGDLADR